MATTLHLVHKNFIWRLESIAPTSSLCGKGFFRLDPKQLIANESIGLERSFVVSWLSSDEDQMVTDYSERVAEHSFLVQVMYWPGRGWETAHELMLQDRHDICETLRDDRLYVGYDADNTATDLKIISRIRQSDEVDISDPELWVLRQTWSVTIREAD